MKIRFLVLFAILIAPMVLLAHHGFEMFDQKRVVTLKGTVKDWQWTNPHTRILLDVEQDGKIVVWDLEGISISQLGHMGWKREFIKIGDKITVEIFPLRNGKPGGQWSRVFDASGKEIGASLGTAIGASPAR